MTHTTRRLLLGLTMAIMAIFLIAFAANRDLVRDAARPEELDALARYVAEHPADWLAVSAMSDKALDADLPRRHDLWRAAYAHASTLAPRRPNPAASFVRGGLFHWYELGPADRNRVLAAAAPLLRDPQTFRRMHRSLWQLTGDLDYLRKNAPANEPALRWLSDVAAMNGRFDDYRELRAELEQRRRATFEAQHASLTPPQIVAMLPPRPTTGDVPLVRRMLEELQRRPLDPPGAASEPRRANDLISFALRHGLRPLEGLEAVLETPKVPHATRARLAVALGRDQQASAIELAGSRNDAQWAQYYSERAAFEAARGDQAMAALYVRRASIAAGESTAKQQWTGTCGKNEVCHRPVTTIVQGPLVLNVQNAQSDEIPPYVEIYVNDTLAAEGPIENARAFALNAAPKQTVEVRLVNPYTRNRIQRRVRLS